MNKKYLPDTKNDEATKVSPISPINYSLLLLRVSIKDNKSPCVYSISVIYIEESHER